jgi:hypothetical protein
MRIFGDIGGNLDDLCTRSSDESIGRSLKSVIVTSFTTTEEI